MTNLADQLDPDDIMRARLACLEAVVAYTAELADGEAISAYVILENAVGRFLGGRPAEDIVAEIPAS